MSRRGDYGEDLEGDLSSSSLFPALAPKSFQLLILSLKETEAENAETDSQRETQTMDLCTCGRVHKHSRIQLHTQTQTIARLHTPHNLFVFSLFLSGFAPRWPVSYISRG